MLVPFIGVVGNYGYGCLYGHHRGSSRWNRGDVISAEQAGVVKILRVIFRQVDSLDK